MDSELLNKYLELKSKGLRKEASVAVRKFISSFDNSIEKEKWVIDYLNSLPKDEDSRIRHELFEEVIFPVLYKGYKENDLWSCLMLARFIQNIYKSEKLNKMLDNHSDYSLLKKCFAIDPKHVEVRERLLNAQIKWFGHCVHEWPLGILSGMAFASKSQSHEILKEIEFAKELDHNNSYSELLDDVQEKVHIYLKKV